VSLREDPGPESPEVAHQGFEMPVAQLVQWPPQKPLEPALVDAAVVAPSTETPASQGETSAVATTGADLEGAPEAVRLEPDHSRETSVYGDATSGETAMECDAELFDVVGPSEGHEVEAAA
jgi:hypothetical protein